MATLYVRNFPDELYHSVQTLASKKNMSISTEVISLMEEVVDEKLRIQRSIEAMERIEARYEAFKPSIDGKDTTALLREDRDR